jgi:7-cyano-7-deazaguanine synthase in queuosine biosynthesis
MKKGVILYSGGIDSLILREYLSQHGHDFDCLYFHHGGRYMGWEEIKIEQLGFELIKCDMLYLAGIEKDDAFIPNRNILMSIAANSLGYDTIWIGGSKSDRVCDNNEKVFENLSEFLTTMNGRYIKIDSPFWNCYKDDMVRWYIKSKDPCDLVYNTFSCFTPWARTRKLTFKLYDSKDISYETSDSKDISYETSECLKCAACFRKCAVLYSAGIFVNYENAKTVKKYYDDFSHSIVSNARSEGTLKYIDRWIKEGNSL